MKKTLLLLTLALFFTNYTHAQNDAAIEAQIDQLFKSVSDKTKPGVAAGMIKDGKIIYLKGYGCSNLATGAPITVQTKFQLGELSKQFTTLAILLLEQQGKISLKDDIRKHLTELPKYSHTITIGHLLNHTSGLNDINRINNIVNGSMNISTQEKALKLISAQKKLAYQPGTQFSFHEAVTESVLMAEIVARVTKQTFADFVQTQIFQPLGMNNSTIRTNDNNIISNAALPYQTIEGSDAYDKNEVRSNVIGAINAYSSAEDLAKWYANYHNPQGKLGKLIQKLDNPVQLTNGQKFVYYWGEMAIGREFTHPERGLPIFWNFGFQGAYGTNVFRYLDQKIITFALGNNNMYNGGFAHDMVDLLVEDLYPLPPEIDFEKKDIQSLTTEQLEKLTGNYWLNTGYASEIFIEKDTLRSKWLFGNRSQTLVPLPDNTFQQYAKMEDTRLFRFREAADGMTIHFSFNESTPDIMKRYEPMTPSATELKNYEGIYYNADYGSLFSFNVEEGQLVAKNFNHNDINLTPVTKDVFTSTSMFLNAVTFLRSNSDKITGFKIVTDGVQDLVFEKVNATK